MEYLHATLMLQAMGKPITEENVKRLFDAVEVEVDEVRLKALVDSVNELDIDKLLIIGANTYLMGPSIPISELEEESDTEEEPEEEDDEIVGLDLLFGDSNE